MSDIYENIEVEDLDVEKIGEDHDAEVEETIIEDKPQKEKVGKVVPFNGLNVRTNPDKNANVVEIIPRDTKVAIVGEDGDWFSIVTEFGVKGFCMKEFIRIEE